MIPLTAEQLQDMRTQNEDFLLINTLDASQFSSTQIPGSLNIPQSADDFVEQVDDKTTGKDQKVVVYCASKACDSSPQAAQKLENAGFTNVYDFEAGAEGWKRAGHSLVGV